MHLQDTASPELTQQAPDEPAHPYAALAQPTKASNQRQATRHAALGAISASAQGLNRNAPSSRRPAQQLPGCGVSLAASDLLQPSRGVQDSAPDPQAEAEVEAAGGSQTSMTKEAQLNAIVDQLLGLTGTQAAYFWECAFHFAIYC